MRKHAYSILVVLFVLLRAGSLSAQGTLRGLVTDSLTANTLAGANVYLDGTALGSATDIEGEFRILRIPPGTYQVKVSYIGYLNREYTVQIRQNETTILNVELMYEVIQGKAVTVTAQAEGQVAAINQQITSNTIINVISEEKIQELPDANAAEAIGRLPGVSLQRSGGEANKVVLRGLSAKFSSITVDGMRIASTDANSRGVDLSTISQGSLAGVELYKALTPDKDADAIAGSVNLVTKKAPSQRLVRLDAKGSYNDLEQGYDQYDFNFRFGQRFYRELLGVQIGANTERRIRSREYFDVDYNMNTDGVGGNWEINDLTLNYTDEIRRRNGVNVLLDFLTPDGGTIRFNNIYNYTKRDFIEYGRNYPTTSDPLQYSARDREQEIYTLNSFLKGENYLFGFETDWGISYATSNSEYPYDYEVTFLEPSSLDSEGNPVSHMLPTPNNFKGPLEDIIPYALNNFGMTYFNTAFYRNEISEEIDRNVFLNIAHKYTLGRVLSGEFKFGGKHKSKTRSRSMSELFAPYYNVPFSPYIKQEDGTLTDKDFTGTRFENYDNVGGKIILFTNFINDPPDSRDLFDKYSLNPIMNRDAIRDWWTLNQDGYSNTGPEYNENLEPDVLFYDIVERVSAGYAMNTLNFGQRVTWIAGIRAEIEDNEYDSRYSPDDLSGFPVPKGSIRDTSAVHEETIWLPNTHLNIKPTSFMSVRLAAYKALARPDFNHRLANFVARKTGTFYPGNSFIVGNPGLKAAKAWNYEVNTSFYGKGIGLFSVSAFYKDIEDMYHLMDGLTFKGPGVLDSLGITHIPSFADQLYTLTYPYNSLKPTRVWGFEIEHQTNLRFLPGLLKNLVASYNFSIVRSETYIPHVEVDTVLVQLPGMPFKTPKYFYNIVDQKQKLEGQPEFFGNFAVGYDIRGFSIRLSVFHQGEFNRTFSPNRRSDTVENSYTRWDLAIRQHVTEKVSLLFNINNLTDVEEGTSIRNRVMDWKLQNNAERYGMTADLGIRVEL